MSSSFNPLKASSSSFFTFNTSFHSLNKLTPSLPVIAHSSPTVAFTQKHSLHTTTTSLLTTSFSFLKSSLFTSSLLSSSRLFLHRTFTHPPPPIVDWTLNTSPQRLTSSPNLPFTSSTKETEDASLNEHPFSSTFSNSDPVSSHSIEQVSSTSNTSESTTSPSDSLPDLNWFVDPPPKDLPPRWLRPFNATSTQTFTTPELTDTTPTALQTYLNDHQAMDVQHLDLTDVHDLCQDLVVATFSHPGHLQSVAKDLKHQFKKLGMLDLVVDGMESQEWIVMDLGHVWVHLFCSEAREKYNIEGLWLRIKELHHEVMDPTMLEKKEGSIPALNMDPFEVFTNELQKEEEEEEEKYAQVRRQ